jgi:hypothetical protein
VFDVEHALRELSCSPVQPAARESDPRSMHDRRLPKRARTLAPRSPEPGAGLLSVAVLERTPLTARRPLLEQACAFDSVCESARVAMLTGLEPHLGGSIEALLAFARESAREHPGNPNLGLLIGLAHRKAALAFDEPEPYFRDPRVFDEVERAYGDYLAVHPDAFRHQNEYARLACWAGRRDTARRAFEAIGAEFSAYAWRDDFREFVQRRKWAFSASPTKELARIAP